MKLQTTVPLDVSFALTEESQSGIDNPTGGGHIYNNHRYLLSEPGFWTEGQAQAEALGGNLVTINDAAEEKWLQDTFGYNRIFWIGLTDQAQERNWQWIDGSQSTYRNWGPGQPDNLISEASPFGEDYAVLDDTFPGWVDISNTFRQWPGIIEIPLSNPPSGNLLRNGSFEQTSLPPTNAFRTIKEGSLALEAWTITEGTIDLVNKNYWETSDGDYSLDMNGNGPGGIAQSFTTIPRQTYRLTFDLASNILGDGPFEIEVKAAEQSASFDFDNAGRSRFDMGWQTETWDFTATDTITTLEFLSTSATGGIGPAIDNARVVPIQVSSVLDFEGLGLSGRGDIPSTYGDRLPSTPNVTVDYRTVNASDGTTAANNLDFWTTRYGDLTNVAYPVQNGQIGEISLIPDDGFAVTLNSFRLGGWPTRDQNNQTVRILDEEFNTLLDYSPFDVEGDSGSSLFTPAITSAETIRIQFGPSWYVGIDDISFNQGIVQPSPTIIGTDGLDRLTGTSGEDVIIGLGGSDQLTGNGGRDRFVYQSPRDGLDTIADFEVGIDQFVLTDVFANSGVDITSFEQAISDGYLTIRARGTRSLVSVDVDGAAGPTAQSLLAMVYNVSAADLSNANNFVI
jgi:choice-of-anchor C domain-containing protein